MDDKTEGKQQYVKPHKNVVDDQWLKQQETGAMTTGTRRKNFSTETSLLIRYLAKVLSKFKTSVLKPLQQNSYSK